MHSRLRGISSSFYILTLTCYITPYSTHMHHVIPTDLRAPTPTMPAGVYLIICILNEKKISLTTNSSSKYLDTAIWSPRPFLRLVFKTKSRASACPDAGSSGLSLILVSVGSPVRIKRQRFLPIRYVGTDREQSTNGQTLGGKMLAPVLLFAGLSQIRWHQSRVSMP